MNVLCIRYGYDVKEGKTLPVRYSCTVRTRYSNGRLASSTSDGRLVKADGGWNSLCIRWQFAIRYTDAMYALCIHYGKVSDGGTGRIWTNGGQLRNEHPTCGTFKPRMLNVYIAYWSARCHTLNILNMSKIKNRHQRSSANPDEQLTNTTYVKRLCNE